MDTVAKYLDKRMKGAQDKARGSWEPNNENQLALFDGVASEQWAEVQDFERQNEAERAELNAWAATNPGPRLLRMFLSLKPIARHMQVQLHIGNAEYLERVWASCITPTPESDGKHHPKPTDYPSVLAALANTHALCGILGINQCIQTRVGASYHIRLSKLWAGHGLL